MATTGPSRRRLPAGVTREVLALNLNRMMESRYKEASNRPLSLAKDAGVSLSTVQRTLGRGNSTIDTIEAFAKVLGVPAFQMLVPWGLLGDLAAKAGDGRTSRRAPLFQGNYRAEHGRSARVRRRRSA